MEFEGLLDNIAAQDGGLVEIYVSSTTLEDWQRMVAHADGAGYLTEFTHSGVPIGSTVRGEMFNQDGDVNHLLRLSIGKQNWTTVLYAENEIDLQGDPREITTVEDLRIIHSYMESLNSAIGKRVFLAPESLNRETVAPYFSVG